MTRIDNERRIRAPRGPERTAKSWQTEAALRMLMNNLDPERRRAPRASSSSMAASAVPRATGRPSMRIVAARCKHARGRMKRLLVQSGKPVGIFRTHKRCAARPHRQFQSGAALGRRGTHFNELDRKGLMMYGQMTAGSWIYIGTQGIVQGTYETFAEVGRKPLWRQSQRANGS